MSRYSPPVFDTPPRRILIIKPSAIGDVVHALPVLNLLRLRWPQSHISWLITPACAGILQGHPQIDELISFDRKGLAKSWRSLSTAREMFRFSRSLREHQFDLVIDLQGLFRSGLMAWETRAAIRVGSTDSREFGGIFHTHLAKLPRLQTGSLHAVGRYLTVAEFLGLGRDPVKFIFPTDDQDRQYIQQLLGDTGRFAVILPLTPWPTKRWPVEKFAALVEPLREKFGLQTVLAGGADAMEVAGSIPGVINLAGKTSLRQIVALLERADLVIANDTGPMHIAAALGRPLVTMFGPTNPVFTGPYQRMESVIKVDIPCSPCFSRKCSHQSCLRWLEVEAVLEAAGEQISAECKMQSAK